jgi:hypothetical protein
VHIETHVCLIFIGQLGLPTCPNQMLFFFFFFDISAQEGEREIRTSDLSALY